MRVLNEDLLLKIGFSEKMNAARFH